MKSNSPTTAPPPVSPAVARVIVSLATLFTTILFVILLEGTFENVARLLALGFLCVTLWIIIAVGTLIRFGEEFISTIMHEHKN